MRRAPVAFVVLTSPRSGSGWLIDTLSSHPAVVAYAELFHLDRRTAPEYGASDVPNFEAHLASASVPSWTRRARLFHRAAFLRRVYAARPGAHAVVDAERLLSRLVQDELAVSRARRQLERLRLPRLEVSYEKLVGRREETLARVLGFPGVEPEPRVDLLDSSLVRASTSSHLELVENADEVRAVLAGTRFEWMLDEKVAVRVA